MRSLLDARGIEFCASHPAGFLERVEFHPELLKSDEPFRRPVLETAALALYFGQSLGPGLGLLFGIALEHRALLLDHPP
jgi:hypothetical protein